MSRLRSRLRARKGEDDNLSGRLITLTNPGAAAAESYRTLRTNLLYALVDAPPKIILLTSPGRSEGKSTTCANLGIVLAQAKKTVLIVDCDLRRPAVHRLFGLRNLQGIVNVLVGERTLQEVWHESIQGLKVVCAGPLPPNPVELLSSGRFAEFLRQVRDEFDYVLIDAPPIAVASDPLVLATQADGALLVLDAQSTRKGAVRQAVRSLEAVGVTVLGTVMNNTRASKSDYYYNYRYGYN